VHNALGKEVFEAIQQLDKVELCLVRWEEAIGPSVPLEHRLQCTVAKLEDHVQLLLVWVIQHVVQLDHVAMPQTTQQRDLALDMLLAKRDALEPLLLDNLDGNTSAQERGGGPINRWPDFLDVGGLLPLRGGTHAIAHLGVRPLAQHVAHQVRPDGFHR